MLLENISLKNVFGKGLQRALIRTFESSLKGIDLTGLQKGFRTGLETNWGSRNSRGKPG